MRCVKIFLSIAALCVSFAPNVLHADCADLHGTWRFSVDDLSLPKDSVLTISGSDNDGFHIDVFFVNQISANSVFQNHIITATHKLDKSGSFEFGVG